MNIERRDTDKHNEELRAEADEIERKVSTSCDLSHPPNVHLRNVTPAQMADHLKHSEVELGELLTEYWALRNRTCE
jgi:hypothetical protein